MALTSALYAVTKVLIALLAWVTSGPIDNCNGTFGSALTRFRVTPGIAPVTVLPVLENGIPSIVSVAFVPPTAASNFRFVAGFAMVVSSVLLELKARDPAGPFV